MPLTDIFELIDDPDMQIPGGLTVTRTSFSTTQDSRGDFVANAPTAVPVNPIMVHTASARDLLQLPETDHNFETVVTYTKVRVFCDDAVQDFLRYQDRDWKFVKVADYSIQGGGYWAMAQLREQVAA